MNDRADDDVKKLAGQYKQRLEQENLANRRFLEERELIKTQGPKLWSDLRDLIRSKRDGINNELGPSEVLSWEEPNSNHWIMRRQHDSAALEGVFDPLHYAATFRCEEAKIYLELHISAKSGQAEFVQRNSAAQVEAINKPANIAHGLMSEFLNR